MISLLPICKWLWLIIYKASYLFRIQHPDPMGRDAESFTQQRGETKQGSNPR